MTPSHSQHRGRRFNPPATPDPEVTHACPADLITGTMGPDGLIRVHNPSCPTCLGAGVVSLDRLIQWECDQNRAAAQGTL